MEDFMCWFFPIGVIVAMNVILTLSIITFRERYVKKKEERKKRKERYKKAVVPQRPLSLVPPYTFKNENDLLEELPRTAVDTSPKLETLLSFSISFACSEAGKRTVLDIGRSHPLNFMRMHGIGRERFKRMYCAVMIEHAKGCQIHPKWKTLKRLAGKDIPLLCTESYEKFQRNLESELHQDRKEKASPM